MSDEGRARLMMPVSDRDHQQGPVNAPVTLVEYGDFECPYCRAAVPLVREVQRRMGDQLRYVFRHFPLTSIHPHAQNAAEVAEAAAVQGKFFEMHAALFENQEALDDDNLVRYAADLDLDAALIRRELAAHSHAGRVREDFESGIRGGARGTPTFYLDDIRYDGLLGVRQILAAIQALHPDVVIADAEDLVNERTLPRVVERQSPFRPPPG